jgi:hypothetical protein
MVLTKKVDGEILYAANLNNNYGETLTMIGLNHIRTLLNRAGVYSKGNIDLFGDAYTALGGRNVSMIGSSALFDTNKHKYKDWSAEPHVIITTSSAINVTAVNSDYAGNNIACLAFNTEGAYNSSKKVILYCTSGTNEVKYAQIYKTLFYGTNGGDSLCAAYTGVITALQTSDSADVGDKGYYARMNVNFLTTNGNATYTGTFANTTTNTAVRSWSVCYSSGTATVSTLEMPSATVLNTATSSTSNEMGTDTSADEKNNPASVVLKGAYTTTIARTTTSEVIVMAKSAVSWAYAESSAYTETISNIDFYTTHGVPAMTISNLITDGYNLIYHALPTGTFSATMSSAFGVALLVDWETGADVQYKLTNATEDTGFLTSGTTCAISNFTAFTSQPTVLTIKLIPKSSSPTASYPSIGGFAVRGA